MAIATFIGLVTSAIGGALTGLGASGIGGAIAGIGTFSAQAFAGGFALFAGIGGSVFGALLSTGLSIGAQALLRPKSGGSFAQTSAFVSPAERLVNIRQAIPVRTRSYGRVRIGGPIYIWTAKNGKRYYGVLVNSGEVSGFVSRYLDEREVTLDSSRFVADGAYFSGGRSRVIIEEYRGEPDQISPNLLNANFDEWTDNHKVIGCAHAVIAAENCAAEDFQQVYPSGREPVYTAVLDATKCYDPRNADQVEDDPSTWLFTRNAALIMAHWATDADGLGRQVDWEMVAGEADVCDEPVVNRDGGHQPLWELCGSYSFGEDRETVRAQMAVACDAFWFETVDGKVGFRVGRYIEPTVTITGANILSCNLTEGPDGTDIKNSIVVQYCEPSVGYREEQAAAYIIDDGQAYAEDTISAFWVPSHNQAVRVGKRLLLQSRALYRLSARLKLKGLRLIGERFFILDYDEIAIDHVFEIDRLTYGSDGLSVEVEAHSVLPIDFEFNADQEESAQPQRDRIGESRDVPDPTNVTARAVATGDASVAILVDFDEPPRDTFVHQIRYRVQSPQGPWFIVDVPSGQSYQFTATVTEEEVYDAQVRAQSQVGRTSNWSPATPISVTATPDTTPTDDVSGASATGGSGYVDLAWTAPSSGNYFATRIYRNTVDDYPNSDLVAVEDGPPSAADSYRDSGLAAGTYYYWLVAMNGSGVTAPEVSTGSVAAT